MWYPNFIDQRQQGKTSLHFCTLETPRKPTIRNLSNLPAETFGFSMGNLQDPSPEPGGGSHAHPVGKLALSYVTVVQKSGIQIFFILGSCDTFAMIFIDFSIS